MATQTLTHLQRLTLDLNDCIRRSREISRRWLMDGDVRFADMDEVLKGLLKYRKLCVQMQKKGDRVW